MTRITTILCLVLLAGAPFGLLTAQVTTPADFEEIALRVAERLGLDAEDLSEEQDLVADYKLDRLVAYEIVAMLCDYYGRPLPDAELTSLADIKRHLMVPPERVTGSRAVPEPPYRQKVYYGTDRRRTGSEEATDMYGGERSPRGAVEYGTCEVTIPASHKPGHLESPFLGIDALASPDRHIRLVSVNPMTDEVFWGDMTEFLSGNADEVLIFIHGFNVTFEEAARRTAQIAFDLDFAGIPIFWSWPSDARVLGYMADREDIEWSVAHIERFLRDTRARSGDAHIHLVAHSMGSQGLLRALRMIVRGQDAGDRYPLFDNVLLAAPDFDAEIFEQQLAQQILPVSARWTVYASEQDAALQLSTNLNSAQRLGLPIIAVNGVDMIDASGIQVTPWNVPEFHSYFATKTRVIDDIKQVFAGMAPSKRSLLRSALNELPYWRLATAPTEE